MNAELTGDSAVDSVITTPQSEWSPYQIAVANLNPDLKSKNKRYQNAFNAKSVLENERVNLGQAGEIMMNAYKNAIDYADAAASQMMNANAANAAIQAGAMVSGSAGLATNPAAAAQTRLAAQNQAIAQNMQIRSNADQNIASIYNNIAQVPSTLSSISSNNRQAEANAIQAEANANLANAQANYYNKQATSTGGSYSTKKTSNGGQEDETDEEGEFNGIVDGIDITKMSDEKDGNGYTHYYVTDDKGNKTEISKDKLTNTLVNTYKSFKEAYAAQQAA